MELDSNNSKARRRLVTAYNTAIDKCKEILKSGTADTKKVVTINSILEKFDDAKIK